MNYAQLLFPDFSLILAGHLVCRYTALGRPIWESVEALVYYLLFPVLLFHSIAKTPIHVGEMSTLMLAGLLMTGGGIVLSQLLPRLPGVRAHIDARDHAGAAQTAFRFNTFIALALAERVAGDQGLQLVAVLVGVCVPLVNVAAVWPMARHSEQHLLRELARNPLIIATLAGLAFNFAGLALPSWSTQPIARIGAASIALGLMATGAGLKWGALLERGHLLSALLLSIRHLLLPLWAWVLARAIGLDDVQRSVLLAFSGLPTASSCYVLAVRMGYNGPYVAGLITLSTLLALASLPLALGVLL